MKIGFLSNLNLHLASQGSLDRFFDHLGDFTKGLDCIAIAGNIADYDSLFYFLRYIKNTVFINANLVFHRSSSFPLFTA